MAANGVFFMPMSPDAEPLMAPSRKTFSSPVTASRVITTWCQTLSLTRAMLLAFAPSPAWIRMLPAPSSEPQKMSSPAPVISTPVRPGAIQVVSLPTCVVLIQHDTDDVPPRTALRSFCTVTAPIVPSTVKAAGLANFAAGNPGAIQPAPAPRVPLFELGEESLAAVPVPSSNFQYPTSPTVRLGPPPSGAIVA